MQPYATVRVLDFSIVVEWMCLIETACTFIVFSWIFPYSCKKSHKITIDEEIDKVLPGEMWYALQFTKYRECR